MRWDSPAGGGVGGGGGGGGAGVRGGARGGTATGEEQAQAPGATAAAAGGWDDEVFRNLDGLGDPLGR